MFEVIATAKGFYGKLQKPGEVFSISALSGLGKWMRLTEKGEKQKEYASPEAVKAREVEAEKLAEAEEKKQAEAEKKVKK
jgi:hypothetical protein